jgi:hypothetical protein
VGDFECPPYHKGKDERAELRRQESSEEKDRVILPNFRQVARRIGAPEKIEQRRQDQKKGRLRHESKKEKFKNSNERLDGLPGIDEIPMADEHTDGHAAQ